MMDDLEGIGFSGGEREENERQMDPVPHRQVPPGCELHGRRDGPWMLTMAKRLTASGETYMEVNE